MVRCRFVEDDEYAHEIGASSAYRLEYDSRGSDVGIIYSIGYDAWYKEYKSRLTVFYLRG